MILFLDDDGVRRYLADALAYYRQARRDNGLGVPAVMLDVEQFCDRRRQEATTFCDPGPPAHDGPMLVSLTVAARALGVSARTAQRLAAAGTLPTVTVGRSRRVRFSDLAELVEQSPITRSVAQ